MSRVCAPCRSPVCCHHLPRVGVCRALSKHWQRHFPSIHPWGCSAAGILECSWVGLSLASSDQIQLRPALGALPFGVTPHPSCFPLVSLVSLVFHFLWLSCSSPEHQQPQLSDRQDLFLLCHSRHLEIMKLLWDTCACSHVPKPGLSWHPCPTAQLLLAPRAASVFTC